jgi:RNA polymerase sigma-70 factor (ECF subfamily)
MNDSVEGRPLDEAELIEHARNGDVDAFTTLVRSHQLMALRVAMLVVGDRTEAEDVTQEAFLKAHRNLHRFSEGSPFQPWILSIVRNQARNRLRGNGRRIRWELQVANDPVLGNAAPSPETAVLAEEERSRLLAALERLPERYRTALGCRYLLEMTEADTATVLGIARGTVKSRSARGLSRLRQMLAGEGLADD